MAQDQAVPAPSVREEIQRALYGADSTAKALAARLLLPARVVREQLEMMGRENIVASRLVAGHTVYRVRA